MLWTESSRITTPGRGFAVVLAVLILAAGSPLLVAYAGQPQLHLQLPHLTGAKWYRGDGLGYNVRLTLAPDGRYTAQWTGCLGVYGNAEGKWSEDSENLTLVPGAEDGMMIGHLRQLKKVTLDGESLLVPHANLGNPLCREADGMIHTFCAFTRESR